MQNLSGIPGSINEQLLVDIAKRYGTPAWVYDASVIRHQLEQFKDFDVLRFAQKACPNTNILRLIRNAGALTEATSLGEVMRAIAAGFTSDQIVLTCDVLDRETLKAVLDLNVTVNAGSTQMLHQIGEASPGHKVWIRVNPGFGHGHSHKVNTGGEHSKHGIWFEDLGESLGLIDRYDLNLVGLHMHIGSGADYHHLESVAHSLSKQVISVDRDIQAISAGGGLSVPYRDGDAVVDIARYYATWDNARREIESHLGHKVSLEIEPGRFIVAQSGYLVAEVRATKEQGPNYFVLVDAGFNDLMRPVMYGSFHRMTLLTPSGERRHSEARNTVVAGPLCESCDVFTQSDSGEIVPAMLPEPEIGDYLVMHDTGAYGAAMSSTYNSRLLAPEVLVDGDDVRLIRRRQTVEDLLMLEGETV